MNNYTQSSSKDLEEKWQQKSFFEGKYSIKQRTTSKLQNQFMSFYDSRLISIVLKIIGKTSVDSVLDVGCGCGTDAFHISKYAQNVLGIDISLTALKEGNSLSSGGNKAKTSFMLSDTEYIPIKSNQFDLVLCKDLLHHVPSPILTLKEMKRVTKVGGHVVAIEANGYNPQMVTIGLIHYSVDKGVFKSTAERLSNLFLKAQISEVAVNRTEYLPRAFLFEYRSPLSRFNSDFATMCLSKIEDALDQSSIIEKFANYLVIHGIKKN